ncbi:MAG: PQQ-binding-like beta-propeller repeat protein [Vicinamibacteria bacterium]
MDWKNDSVPGTIAATDGVLLARDETGVVRSVHPRTGVVRWSVEIGIAGTLPAVIDGERAYVAGDVACSPRRRDRTRAVDRPLGTGRHGAPAARRRPPADRREDQACSRDPETGRVTWFATGRALEAPPPADEARGKAYLGTPDRRILEVDLSRGHRGWRWKVGADIVDHGALLPRGIAFAAFDAVLYGLRRGGTSTGGPRSPASSPGRSGSATSSSSPASRTIVVLAPDTGKRRGLPDLTAEIRTPPLVLGGLAVLGLRDWSVVAYIPAGVEPVLSGAGRRAAGAAPDRRAGRG